MNDVLKETERLFEENPDLMLDENRDELLKLLVESGAINIKDSDIEGMKTINMKMKTDSGEFPIRAKYEIEITGPLISKENKIKITYDNDDFESELDLILGGVKTIIMASQLSIKHLAEKEND